MKNSIRLQIKFVNLVLLIFLMFCNFLMGQIRVNQDSVTVTDEKYFFNGNLLTSNVYVLFENQQLKNEFLVLKGLKNGQSIFYVKKENFDKNKYLDTFLVERYQNQIELLLEQFDNLRKDSIGLKTTFDDLFNNKIGGLDKFYDLEEKNNKGKLKGEKKENYDNYFVFKNKIEENKKELLSIRSELSSVNLKLNQEKGKSVFEHTKSELITFKDNNKNGLYEKYEKSKIIETGNYSNNQKNGEWKTYDSYGKLTKLETYIENKKNGKYQEFQNDKLVTEGQYKENLKDGEWKSFDYYGKLSVLENYKQDKREGLSKKYSGDIIIEQGQYVAGLMNGEWKTYSNNGKLTSLSNYLNGKLNGLSKKYSGDIIVEEGQYVDGLMTGEWVFRYQNGKLHGQGKYFKGDGENLGSTGIPINGREGKWTLYHENGKKSQEGNYINGKSEGEFIYYFDNGNKKSVNQYKNGTEKFDGSKKEIYNEDGSIKSKWLFSNGEWEEELTSEQRFARMQKQMEEMNKKADILEQQINEQLERQNSSNNTRSNSSYTKSEKNDTESCSRCKGTGVCKECGKPQRVRYYKNGWREDEETRIGKTVCSTCHGDGTIDEHISLNSNKIDRYENCYYSSCYSGWVKCRRCYGKGKCDLCHGSGKKK